jgi:hypothetical protein
VHTGSDDFSRPSLVQTPARLDNIVATLYFHARERFKLELIRRNNIRDW